MKKTILALATFTSVMSIGALSGCAYPDHSGPYMDQHNGRQEQSNADRRDRRDDGNYRDDRDHRDDNQTDPRRQ